MKMELCKEVMQVKIAQSICKSLGLEFPLSDNIVVAEVVAGEENTSANRQALLSIIFNYLSGQRSVRENSAKAFRTILNTSHFAKNYTFKGTFSKKSFSDEFPNIIEIFHEALFLKHKELSLEETKEEFKYHFKYIGQYSKKG